MADFLNLPLPTSDEPVLTQVVQLEGRTYRFTFDYNARTDRWTLNLTTESGVSVLAGAVLVLGIDLLRTVPSTLSYAPPGQLYVVGADDPTLATIGTVNLIYITST